MPLLKCSNVLFVVKVALSALTSRKFSLHTFALSLCSLQLSCSLCIFPHFTCTPSLLMPGMHPLPFCLPSPSPPLSSPSPSLLLPFPLPFPSLPLSRLSPCTSAALSPLLFPFSHPFTLLLFPSSSLHDHSFSRRVHVHWTS